MKSIMTGGLKRMLIILFLAVSLIPIAVIGYMGYQSGKSAVDSLMSGSFAAIADSREFNIATLLELRKQQAEMFAAKKIVQNFVEDCNRRDRGETVDEAALKEVAAELAGSEFSSIMKITPYYELMVLGASGKVLVSNDRFSPEGTDMSKDEVFLRGLKEAFIADVAFDQKTGKPFYGAVAPVFLHDSGQKTVIGVVMGKLNPMALNSIVANNASLGKTGESYIVNRNGLMITESRMVKDAVLNQKVDTEPVKLFRTQKKNMAGVYRDYRGTLVLGASEGDHIDKEFGLGWTVVVEMDASEAFAAAEELRKRILLLSLGLGFLIAVIAWVVAGSIAGKIQNAVNQITSAGTEILAASQQQSASAREQSSAVAETTSAATELSKSAEQIGENIRRVAQIANHALAGMAKIKEGIGKTGEKITSLNEKSREIGKITELINDVADQTNLLAVNAAIEAARAGEQGRGFTVVADEIRKLADSTAKSTKDITALIEIIQHEMTNAIMSMEESVSNVNEEVKLSQESAESAKEISMSATQQVSGSKQIADAMANINDAMKEIASGAQQAQVAAKQLTELATELKKMI